jgi:hypothetical protein
MVITIHTYKVGDRFAYKIAKDSVLIVDSDAEKNGTFRREIAAAKEGLYTALLKFGALEQA